MNHIYTYMRFYRVLEMFEQMLCSCMYLFHNTGMIPTVYHAIKKASSGRSGVGDCGNERGKVVVLVSSAALEVEPMVFRS